MLDHLIQQIPSQMRSQSGYMQLLSRDFKKIMELAAPDTPAGQANVRNASQVRSPCLITEKGHVFTVPYS